MRKLIQVAVVLGLTLTVCFSASAPNAGENSPQAALIAEGPNPYKTQDQAEAAAVKALGGDADSAWGLALYFGGPHHDTERFDYWLLVAADNGNPNALYVIARDLRRSEDPCAILRGIHYLELTVKATPQSDAHGLALLHQEIASSKARVEKLAPPKCLRTTARPH